MRRAYAEKLKVTRPEDDREGFMALRRAFETARETVRWDVQDTYDSGEDDAGNEADAAPPEREDYDPPADSMDEAATWQPPAPEVDPVDAAYLRLVDLLTSPWGASSMAALRAIIDDDAVSGIDEYQQLGGELRHFLCDRTGMFLDGNTGVNLPGWLSLAVFDTLDDHFGWTRAQPANRWLTRQHDWLVKVRAAIAGEPVQPVAEPAAARTDGETGGGLVWLVIGAAIIGFQVIRFLMNLGG